MKAYDFIKAWLGKSNGPGKRPEGGFISQHRKERAEGDGSTIWTPSHTGKSKTVDFADLFQGRQLGHQAQGYGAELPTVIGRGQWTIVVESPGSVTRQDTVTGGGGQVVRFDAPDMALVRIAIHDQWDNKLTIMAYNAHARQVTLSFRDSGDGRQLQVIST